DFYYDRTCAEITATERDVRDKLRPEIECIDEAVGRFILSVCGPVKINTRRHPASNDSHGTAGIIAAVRKVRCRHCRDHGLSGESHDTVLVTDCHGVALITHVEDCCAFGLIEAGIRDTVC